MTFSACIINSNEIIREGTTKIFNLTTYHPETKNDNQAKHRKIFVDYTVSFQDGTIVVSMNFLEKTKIIKRVGLGYNGKIVETDTISNEKVYYITGKRLYFTTD